MGWRETYCPTLCHHRWHRASAAGCAVWHVAAACHRQASEDAQMSVLADLGDTPNTPFEAARDMCRYISCNRTVAMHVKRLHGVEWSPVRIDKIRNSYREPTRGEKRGGGTGKDEETGLAEQGRWVAAAVNGNRDFLRALAEGRR
jgi:hypothetical protein